MKKYIYIITKEGRAYSDEGLEHVRDEFSKEPYFVKKDSDVIICQGGIYNDPTYLAEELRKKDRDSYLVISADFMGYFGPKDMEKLANLLVKYPNQTSWETIYFAVGE